MSPIFKIPNYVAGRVTKKPGRLLIFGHFDAFESALVVPDMQKFYVGDVTPALEIIRPITAWPPAFLRAARQLCVSCMTVS